MKKPYSTASTASSSRPTTPLKKTLSSGSTNVHGGALPTTSSGGGAELKEPEKQMVQATTSTFATEIISAPDAALAGQVEAQIVAVNKTTIAKEDTSSATATSTRKLRSRKKASVDELTLTTTDKNAFSDAVNQMATEKNAAAHAVTYKNIVAGAVTQTMTIKNAAASALPPLTESQKAHIEEKRRNAISLRARKAKQAAAVAADAPASTSTAGMSGSSKNTTAPMIHERAATLRQQKCNKGNESAASTSVVARETIDPLPAFATSADTTKESDAHDAHMLPAFIPSTACSFRWGVSTAQNSPRMSRRHMRR